MRPANGRRHHGGEKRPRGSKDAPGARVEGVVERYVPGGLGVVRVEGRVHLVAGVLRGERVELESGSPRAHLLRVIEASPERVEPPCRYVDACGGCDFMRLSAEAQREAHAEIVRELVAHAMGVRELPEVVVTPAPSALGYRTRARLAFRARAPKSVVVGYRRERSRDLVAVERCVVLDERLDRAIAIARGVLAGSTAEGDLSVALGKDERPVVELRAAGELAPGAYARLDEAVRSGELAGARVVLEGARDALAFGDPRAVQRGADGLDVVLGAGGFAQSSDEGAALLSRAVRELAEPADKRVVELFAGSGTLSILLAPGARAFTAIELDERSVASARENVAARGLAAKLVTADANAIAIPSADVVVLDPPRTGAKEASQAVARARPKRVVYVSCDPATLARDLEPFAREGYAVTALRTFELFPQTSHVETVVRLELTKKRPA